MNLFHFTPLHLLNSIRHNGLTRGVLPIHINGNLGFLMNIQWLTVQKNWDQSWNQDSHLPYDRTAARLIVTIPDNDPKLSSWLKARDRFADWLLPHFDDPRYSDPDHWWIYEGHIPREWIGKTKYRKASY